MVTKLGVRIAGGVVVAALLVVLAAVGLGESPAPPLPPPVSLRGGVGLATFPADSLVVTPPLVFDPDAPLNDSATSSTSSSTSTSSTSSSSTSTSTPSTSSTTTVRDDSLDSLDSADSPDSADSRDD